MKYLTSTVFAMLLLGMANAQVYDSVTEGAAPYPKMSDAFSIKIAGVDAEFVVNSWREFLSDYYTTTEQIERTDGETELKSENIFFPPLNNEKVDILSIIRTVPSNQDVSEVLLTIWIHREDNTYLSPDINNDVNQRVKDWLFYFDYQLDKNSFTKD